MTRNIDIVNKFLNAFWEDERALLKSVTHPEFVWDNVPFWRYTRVGDKFERSEKLIYADNFPVKTSIDDGSGRHEIISQSASGDTVLQERYDRMRMKGVEIEMACVGVFKIKEDKVTLWRDYYNFDHWLSQLDQIGVEWNSTWDLKKS